MLQEFHGGVELTVINGDGKGSRRGMSYETHEEMKARVTAATQEILGGLDLSERIAIGETQRALCAVADLCARGGEEDGLRTLEDVAASDMSALLRVISRSLGARA